MSHPVPPAVRLAVVWSLLLAVLLSGLSAVLHRYLEPSTGLERVVFQEPGFPGGAIDTATARRIDLDLLEARPSLPRRMFGIRWRGLWYVSRPGVYQLFLGADDRARLIIDGEPVLERSFALGMGTVSETRSLDAGFHTIEVEYAQDGGGRHLNLQWAFDGGAPAPLDPYALFPAEPTTGTLRLNAVAHTVGSGARLAWLVLLASLVWGAGVRYGWREAWVRFWFPTTTAVPLAVCRLVLVLAWLLLFAKPWAVLAVPLTYDPALINLSLIRGVLTLVPVETFHTAAFLRAIWMVTTVAGVLAAVGFVTRTSLVTFGLGNSILVAHMWSYGEWHHTEALYCLALVLMGLSPSGRCYSVDAWLGRRSKHPERWGPDVRMDTATWALRLTQCLLALAYFSTGSSKLLDGGFAWVNGWTLQTIVLTDYARFGMPAGLWLIESYWLCVAAAVGTLVVETFFFVAVFVPTTRKFILAAGAALHIGIYLTMAAPFFTFIALYVTFVDWEAVRRRWPRRTQGRPAARPRAGVGGYPAVRCGARAPPMYCATSRTSMINAITNDADTRRLARSVQWPLNFARTKRAWTGRAIEVADVGRDPVRCV